jgi:hypothetical protein
MTTVDRKAATALARFFNRNGYVRRPDPKRRRAETWQTYKKGAEVRLVANSQAELARIRALLRKAGFSPGRPFRKANQFRQPVYGLEVVERFLALVKRTRAVPKKRRR